MKRFGRAEINHKRQIDRALNRKLRRICSAKDFPGYTARLLEELKIIGPVRK
jgi:hypothetical protein